MFLSSGDRYVGELLELQKECQGAFRGSIGKVGFLSRRYSGKGPHLTLTGESPGFSQVEAGIMGFLRVMTGTSGTCSCCLRKVKVPWELQGASQDTSPVGAGS